jgi:hypothetical protein
MEPDFIPKFTYLKIKKIDRANSFHTKKIIWPKIKKIALIIDLDFIDINQITSLDQNFSQYNFSIIGITKNKKDISDKAVFIKSNFLLFVMM